MPRGNRIVSLFAVMIALFAPSFSGLRPVASRLRFEVSFPERLQKTPLDGRVLLLFSNDFKNEPRHTTVGLRSPQPFFVVDVEGLKPGQPAVIDELTLGFPLDSIRDLPAGEYNVDRKSVV